MQKAKENSYYLVEKLFRRIFPIQMLICSVGAINSLIDGVIGSRFLGAEAIAAVGLFSPVTILFDGIIAVLSVGAVMVITRYMGKNDKAMASSVFSLICTILGVLGLGLGVVMIIFSGPLSALLKGGLLLRRYMIGYCSFLFARMLANILTDTLQILGNSRRSMLGVLVMAAANIVCDILLVCVFKMGILGLGLATGLSYLAQLLVLLPPYLKKNCPLKFAPARLPREELSELLKGGLPSGLGQLTISIKTFVQNYVLMYLGGTMAVAASSVQSTFCWFMASITVGAGQTTLMLMSLYISEEDRVSMRNVLIVVLRNCLAMGFAAMTAVIALAVPLAAMYYGKEPEAMAYTVSALRIFPLFMLPNTGFYVLMRTYQSQGKKLMTYLFSTSENLVIMVFIAVLGLCFGINGAWAGLPVGSAVLMLAILSIVWIKKKRITFLPEDLLLLPDELGVGPEDRMERTIYNMENAVGLSDDVCAFCRSHSISPRRTHIAGLSVEEISILLFRYSLTDVKNAQADVRIFVKNGKLTLRLRDNGRPLFVGDNIDINDPDDPTANIGIKLLVRMADEIRVNSIMGMNVITVVMSVQ